MAWGHCTSLQNWSTDHSTWEDTAPGTTLEIPQMPWDATSRSRGKELPVTLLRSSSRGPVWDLCHHLFLPYPVSFWIYQKTQCLPKISFLSIAVYIKPWLMLFLCDRPHSRNTIMSTFRLRMVTASRERTNVSFPPRSTWSWYLTPWHPFLNRVIIIY